jgi:inosine/xanthosine triphosphatase
MGGKWMVNIAIGSNNPAKIKAVETAFEMMGYSVTALGMEVPSGVSSQPLSDEETIKGAINRAKTVLTTVSSPAAYDYAVGLEGGVVETPFGMFLCNWGAVINKEGMVGIGGGLRIELPSVVAEQIRHGKELGDVMDEWIGGRNIKKKEGAIGILTANHITRQMMFRDVVITAFSRFLHPAYYV